MKTLILYCLLCLPGLGKAFAQAIYISNTVELQFFSAARFENIEAVSQKGRSAINVDSRELAFKVPIQSFVFDKALMQEHFNENYMESDQFPYATFNGKINEPVDLRQDGNYEVTATGLLNIHGITKTRTITGTILVRRGQLLLTSSFLVPVADHRIDIPKDKLLNISQNITVRVKGVYEAKQ